MPVDYARFGFTPLSAMGSYHINLLIYGESGVGKTMLSALTAPGPVIVLDFDDGTISARSSKSGFRRHIKNRKELIEAIKNIRIMFAQDPKCIGTIVVDNLTHMQRMFAMGIQGGDGLEVSNILEQKQWGIMLNMVEATIENIKTLPCHTIFLAHEGTKDGVIGPAMSGQIRGELPGFFDSVFRYYMVEVQDKDTAGNPIEGKTKTVRVLRTQKAPGVIAKDRSGALKPLEQTPNITEMMSRMIVIPGAKTAINPDVAKVATTDKAIVSPVAITKP